MSTATTTTFSIGVYGSEDPQSIEGRGCGLWPPGYAAAVTASGGTPISLQLPKGDSGWNDALDGMDGLLLLGFDSPTARQTAEEERLCRWCCERGLPVLCIDQGLHALNGTFGGTAYVDLAKELPQALQHRHPPEKGLRHAINVEPDTRLSALYGEGEIVVNSEHRRGINRVAKGFRVCARALDGVIEAIEPESAAWFALGVQWHPASATASGLDIQLFRGLVDSCSGRLGKRERAACAAA